MGITIVTMMGILGDVFDCEHELCALFWVSVWPPSHGLWFPAHLLCKSSLHFYHGDSSHPPLQCSFVHLCLYIKVGHHEQALNNFNLFTARTKLVNRIWDEKYIFIHDRVLQCFKKPIPSRYYYWLKQIFHAAGLYIYLNQWWFMKNDLWLPWDVMS